MRRVAGVLALAFFAATTIGDLACADTTLTIATVNNADMIRMQSFTQDFEDAHPDIHVRWVTLEENVLRQRVTTDIATDGGQFDVMTIGTYEIPIWAKRGWLVPLTDLGASYDKADILPRVREATSVDDKLYGAPFYGESAMTYYRTDLFKKAGLTMPDKPDWAFIKQAADKITDRKDGIYGICLRGKAGWGENMALITSMSNSFGARWFDEKWQPQFNTPEWKQTLQTYVDLMQKDGPPGAASNGFNENLALFNAGKCGLWIDATVAGSFTTNPKESQVANDVGFAVAPTAKERANWLWAWSLAIPSASKKVEAAKTFIEWATDKAYTQLVAGKQGWGSAPPGTRTSLYQNPEYLKAAPYAKLTLASIEAADPNHPTVEPVPYVGVQYAAIPQFQGIGTAVGQQFASALTGAQTVDQALASAQHLTERQMRHFGYIK